MFTSMPGCGPGLGFLDRISLTGYILGFLMEWAHVYVSVNSFHMSQILLRLKGPTLNFNFAKHGNISLFQWWRTWEHKQILHYKMTEYCLISHRTMNYYQTACVQFTLPRIASPLLYRWPHLFKVRPWSLCLEWHLYPRSQLPETLSRCTFWE